MSKPLTPEEIFEAAMQLPDFWDRLEPSCIQNTRDDLKRLAENMGEKCIVYIVIVMPEGRTKNGWARTIWDKNRDKS